MQRYLMPAVIAVLVVILIWVGLAVIAGTRDPREPPPSPQPETRQEGQQHSWLHVPAPLA